MHVVFCSRANIQTFHHIKSNFEETAKITNFLFENLRNTMLHAATFLNYLGGKKELKRSQTFNLNVNAQRTKVNIYCQRTAEH